MRSLSIRARLTAWYVGVLTLAMLTLAVPRAPAYAAWRRFGWWLAFLWPGVGLAAAVGGYWISQRALAPVDRLTRTVQAISLRNLDFRLEVPRPDDELRRLAETFNE